jgi:hypothetical protein
VGGDPTHQIVSIHAGHHYIGENYVEGFFATTADRIVAVLSGSHNVTGAFKRERQDISYQWFVINDKYSRRHRILGFHKDRSRVAHFIVNGKDQFG